MSDKSGSDIFVLIRVYDFHSDKDKKYVIDIDPANDPNLLVVPDGWRAKYLE